MRDQLVCGVIGARRDVPGEFVVSLVLFSLRALKVSNVLVAYAWSISTRDRRHVTHAQIRIVANPAKTTTGTLTITIRSKHRLSNLFMAYLVFTLPTFE